MKPESRIEQIAGIAAVFLLVVGCFLVLRPFVSALLWAAILCFSTWPLYSRLKYLLRERSTLAATCMTLSIAVILVLPFVIVGINLADNVASVVAMVRDVFDKGLPDPPSWVANIPVVGGMIDAHWRGLAHDAEKLSTVGRDMANSAGPWLLQRGVDLGHGIFQLTVSVFIAFFFYRDGAFVVEKVQGAVTRVIGDRTQHLLGIVGGTVKGVVYGILGTALAQGILAGIGFAVSGVPASLLLGLLTFFLSLVPMGPPLVWIPATVWLFYKGSIGWGIFLAIWGTVVVSGVDNVLKPYLISRGSAMPFALVFMGVLGGLVAFGFLGVFLGPTLLAIGYSLVQEWTGQKKAAEPVITVEEKGKAVASGK